mgnify:FL=1
MSTQVTTAFVKQYMANVDFLVQQKGSRLRNAVTLKTGVRGEEVFMDRVGSTAPQKVTSRHADTPLISTPHDRRRITPVSYNWGDLIDNVDRVKMIIDPTSPYAQNAAYAMGRAIDDELLDAISGNAFGDSSGTSGSDASTAIALPSAQKVAVNFHTYDTGSGDKGLTLGKLLKAREILGAGEADDYGLDGSPNLFCAINSKQISNMLADFSMGGASGVQGISAASADYNSVRSLVAGEIDTFMGFKFIRTELLNTDSSSDQLVVCWHRSGVGLAVFDDIKARISERPDKRYSTQVYYEMTIGAARLEEERVVEIACDPS